MYDKKYLRSRRNAKKAAIKMKIWQLEKTRKVPRLSDTLGENRHARLPARRAAPGPLRCRGTLLRGGECPGAGR